MSRHLTDGPHSERPYGNTFIELIPFIEQIDFPALREDLIQEAERQQAPPHLSLFVKWMDGRIYHSFKDIESAFYQMAIGLEKPFSSNRW